jgi:predicted DNA-binding transcriptional regulator AlpA
MDSAETRISFDSMPRILAELRDKIEGLTLLLEQHTSSPSPSEWMDIDQLREYLPGTLTRSTIYQWIRRDGFPYYQNARCYYFRRKEVDKWLVENGRKK